MQNENDHGVGVQAAMEISPRPQQELHAFGEHNQCSIEFFFVTKIQVWCCIFIITYNFCRNKFVLCK
jgi:hypothetical protein